MNAPHPVTRAPQRARDSTRWDIQGLRAFAVLAVVLYHLWPNRLPGGFVGVDVFFVISGFLITGHLVREQLGTGRIALASFWARRAKRLLPGAFLTILATGTAVLLVVPNALWGQYGRELIASTVYLQNWQLASDAVDYLAADNRPSPFQHFWSLSVEEQFYIALPVLLIVVGALLRRWRRATPVVVVRVLLGVVVVLSLTWSVVQTAQAPGVAYFSTATRAWEFALGGLAATVPLPRRHAVRVGGALAGVAALVASLWLITPSMPFPGVVALLPAAGATLVVLLGGRTVLELIGAFRPVAFTGRISYALYLWHWPAVVLLPIALGHPLGFRSKAVVLVGSFLLAAATTVLVEEPLRFSGWVRALRPRRVAVLGAVSTLVVVALGASTLVALQVQQQQAVQFAQDLQRGDVPCFGAAALISAPKPCVNPALADVRVPAPSVAGKDDHNPPACWSSPTPTLEVCHLGKTKGYTKHLLAIGDSHNNVWVDVYDAIGKANGWRIDVAGRGGCYFTDAEQTAPYSFQVSACNQWKSSVRDWVRNAQGIDGVIVTHAAGLRPVVAAPGTSVEQTTVDGMVDAWRMVTDRGIPVIAIRDTPVPRPDVIACVGAMSGPTTDACDQPRSEAFSSFEGSAEAAARVGPLAHVVDLSDYYCTETTCPAVIGGVLVYRDLSHQTLTFAKTMQPHLSAGLERALR